MRHVGEIERTPWWLRVIGYPPRRRWKVVAHIGGIFGEWEYLP